MPPFRRLAPSSFAAAPEAIAEEQDNGTLANLGRWISRPGFMVRSALRGNLGDAWENGMQFMLDAPTGGFLDRRLSLANLVSDTGDITTKEERPEFSDVLDTWGAPTFDKRTSPWKRFGVDLVGGIVTDPLTLVSLGGATVAKGALTGVARGAAGARVAQGLSQTRRGASVLAQAEREVLQEIVSRPGPFTRRLAALGSELTPDALTASRAADLGLSQARLGVLRRGITTRAAEKVMARAIESSPEGAQLGARAAERALVETLPAASRESADVARRGLVRMGRSADEAEATVRGVLDEAVDATGARGVFDRFGRRFLAGVGPTDAFERFTGNALQGDLLDAGIRALEQQGLTHTSGALRLEVPFTRVSTGPLVRDFWSRVGSVTAPGLARKLVHKASPVAGEVLDEAARRSWTWAKGVFSKRLLGDVPEGLRDVVREAAGVAARREAEVRELRDGLFAKLPVGASHVMARQLIDAGEGLRRMRADGLDVAAIERALDEDIATIGRGMTSTPDAARSLLRAAESRLGAVQARELPALRLAVEQATRELERTKTLKIDAAAQASFAAVEGSAAAGKAAARSVLSSAEAQRRYDDALAALRQAETRAAGRGETVAELRVGTKALALAAHRTKLALAERGLTVDPTEVDRALSGYVGAMTKIPAELERLGIWKARDVPDLFYVPNQASDALALFMAAGAHDRRFLTGLRDVFTKRREFKTHAEFVANLKKVARDHNVPIPEGALDDAAGLQTLDLGELLERRLLAHVRTVERATVAQAATKRFGMRPSDPSDVYIRGQFDAAGVRTGALSKLLGGGTFRIPLPSESAVAAARKQLLPIGPGEAAESKVALWKWEGLNAWYKPFLTVGLVVPFPSFVARNVASSMVMGMFDRDIGAAGAWAFFKGLTEAPLVRALSPNAPTDIAKVLRAVREPANEAALKALEGVQVGTHTGAELVRLARQGVVTGATFAERELFEGFRQWPLLATRAGRQELERLASTLEGKELLSRMPPRRVQLLKAAVRFPAAVSSHGEDSFRLGSFFALVKKGVDPTEATRRVSEAFVDYSVQTSTERMIRDLIPFARFTIGSAPVTIRAVAQRPRVFTPFASIMRGGEQETEDGLEAFLPESMRNQVAIPMGKDQEGNPAYLTQLGLPFEAAANALSLIPRPTQGFLDSTRRVIGGGLTPPLRAPLEAVTGQSFHFGEPTGAMRRAPLWFPDWATEGRALPSGREVREVPGWVNAWLLGAMPWSRARFELDRLLDDRKEWWQKTLNVLTGARVQSVELDREARRAVEKYLQAAADRGELGKVESFFAFGAAEDVPPELRQALTFLRNAKKEDRLARSSRREAELRRQGIIQ